MISFSSLVFVDHNLTSLIAPAVHRRLVPRMGAFRSGTRRGPHHAQTTHGQCLGNAPVAKSCQTVHATHVEVAVRSFRRHSLHQYRCVIETTLFQNRRHLKKTKIITEKNMCSCNLHSFSNYRIMHQKLISFKSGVTECLNGREVNSQQRISLSYFRESCHRHGMSVRTATERRPDAQSVDWRDHQAGIQADVSSQVGSMFSSVFD